MKFIDLWLCNKLDGATTWAQRRGYLLTSIRLHSTGLVFASAVTYSLARQNYGLMAFVGVGWGLILMVNTHWAKENQDYPYSVKMLDRLNAEVLMHREVPFYAFIRLLFVWLWFLGRWSDYVLDYNWPMVALSTLADTAIVPYFYLMGCFFIGPGEFAKEEQSTRALETCSNSSASQ